MRQKGFTLIELMVVLSIAAVLGTLGIAGFNNYNKVQVLQSSANEVVTMLNLAKSRAQSQVKSGSACDSASKTLKGYSVDISKTNGSYSLISHCFVGMSELTDTLEAKKLPANLIFDVNISFFFPVQAGGVEVPGQFIISNSDGKQRIIKVNALGGVSVQ